MGGYMNTAAALSNDFRSIFKTEQTPRTFFAPGRINLIGEHTDYNGGHVFPLRFHLAPMPLA